jgi:hypothetical protein
MVGEKIAAIAKSYLGQDEKPGNKGFIDPVFEKKMRAAGFYTGAPWCGFFPILCYKEAGASTALLSGSSYQVIEKASKAGNWHTVPVVGALAVWATFKNGKRQKTGHMGIVTEVNDNGIDYDTTEGNTTDKGGRDGVTVAERFRHLTPDKWTIENGLRLMGFVYPE